jgi:hypothetical protein
VAIAAAQATGYRWLHYIRVRTSNFDNQLAARSACFSLPLVRSDAGTWKCWRHKQNDRSYKFMLNKCIDKLKNALYFSFSMPRRTRCRRNTEAERSKKRQEVGNKIKWFIQGEDK